MPVLAGLMLECADDLDFITFKHEHLLCICCQTIGLCFKWTGMFCIHEISIEVASWRFYFHQLNSLRCTNSKLK